MSGLRITRCLSFLPRSPAASRLYTTATSVRPQDANGQPTASASTEASSSSEQPVPESTGAKKPRKRKAKAPKKQPEPIVEPSGPVLDELLQDLQQQQRSGTVTLEDVDRYKPTYIPLEDQPTYKQEYEPVMDLISSRFSKNQLQNLVIQSGLRPPAHTKAGYVSAILDQRWGMPPPEDVQERLDHRRVVVNTLVEMDHALLFHVIGKDGKRLFDISREYAVRAHFSSQPVGISFSGSQQSIQAVRQSIWDIKKTLIKESFVTPHRRPIPEHLVQQLSRLADAFVRNDGNSGRIHVVARAPEAIQRVKYLAAQVTSDFGVSRLFVLQASIDAPQELPSTLKSAYTLMPFTSRLLPWTLQPELLRFRRVGDWLGLALQDDTAGANGLAGSKRIIRTINDGTTKPLRDAILSHFPSYSKKVYNHRSIVAIPGHIVFSASSPGQNGGFSMSSFAEDVQRNPVEVIGQPTRDLMEDGHHFLSSMPPELADARPSPPHRLKRLLYLETGSDPSAVKDWDSYSRATSYIELEIPLGESSGSVTCKSGMTMTTDLLQPERFMDVRFIARDYNFLGDDERPPELVEYLTRPINPPLHFTWRGKSYVLARRENVDEMTTLLLRPDLQVTRRSVLALDTPAERTSTCSVSLGEDSESGWASLALACDRLTGRGFAASAK
ncbi:unnamed protein product [Peniophora sp. CBMAI 1063]|nr:unnamed protein product [Peniophora sp. CBMAI 1063]